MRKVIQLMSSQSQDAEGGFNYDLMALCDDGTIWEYIPKTKNTPEHWKLFLNVPQGEIGSPS